MKNKYWLGIALGLIILIGFMYFGNGALSIGNFLNDGKGPSEANKDITFRIQELGDGYYHVVAVVEWKVIPKVRGKDILGISFEDTDNDFVVNYDTILGRQFYKASDGTQETSKTIIYSLAEHMNHFAPGSEGVAHWQNLKDDWGKYKVTELKQELEFIVLRDKGNDTKKLTAEAVFLHMIKNNTSMNNGKISITYNNGAEILFSKEKDRSSYKIMSKERAEVLY